MCKEKTKRYAIFYTVSTISLIKTNQFGDLFHKHLHSICTKLSKKFLKHTVNCLKFVRVILVHTTTTTPFLTKRHQGRFGQFKCQH